MTARIVPAGQVTVTLEDMMLDQVCFEYALAHLRDRRQAGKLTGYIETTFAANLGLADLGPILPRGTVIDMPEHVIAGEAPTVRLWD